MADCKRMMQMPEQHVIKCLKHFTAHLFGQADGQCTLRFTLPAVLDEQVADQYVFRVFIKVNLSGNMLIDVMMGTECFIFKMMSRFQYINMRQDRKSTRLNSSHVSISYAVFCL